MSTEVRDNPDENRYEAWVDGELAGFAEYSRRPGTVVLTHTEVLSAFEGKGVGGALAKGVLDSIRSTGEDDVEPACPFIASYIEKHPEYADLLHQR